MVNDAPHITLTMGRDDDGERTTGDIGPLGLGFGIFQAWMYMAVFGVIRIFEPDQTTGFDLFLTESMANSILYAFLVSSAIALIFIGITNQRYLRFYVSKLAMYIGAGLCTLGTLMIFLACVPFVPDAFMESIGVAPLPSGDDVSNALSIESVAGTPLAESASMFHGTGSHSGTLIDSFSTPLSIIAAVVSGVCMGVGSSLLIALWGTSFARSKFTTIVLNAALAMPLGLIVAFLLTIWLPSPISGIVTACLPFAAILVLQLLTPEPFYQRREEPIFVPFPAHKTTYMISMGIPTVIMGVVLGALRVICVGEVLPSGSITIQLVLGAACCMSVIVFVAAIAIARMNPYWDTLFRSIVPIIVIGAVSMPFILGEYAVVSAFFISLGYVCLEVLLWIFFADISSRFKLSPLFVFGVGRGILEVAGVAGSAITMVAFNESITNGAGLVLLALLCVTLMSLGYSLLPRYREFKNIVAKEGIFEDDPEAVKDESDMRFVSLTQDDGAESRYEYHAQSAALAGNSITESTSAVEGEVDPLLAVDGLAEGAEHAAEDNMLNPSQKVTPLGTDAMATNAPSFQDGDSDASKDGHEKGSFYRRCEEIAEQYMLSKREREVLPLLAKGHNAAFIQDNLCVSKSTAKTHINHIYKKLNIHTQQELLNMVEERRRAQKSSDTNPSGINVNNYMLDKDAFAKAVSEAASKPNPSRPVAKRGYRTSIFGD